METFQILQGRALLILIILHLLTPCVVAQTTTPIPQTDTVAPVIIESGEARTPGASSTAAPAASPETNVTVPSPIPARPQKISNSIAVSEFYIRKEYLDFFYDEKLVANPSAVGNPNFVPGRGEVVTSTSQTSNFGFATSSAQSEISYSRNFGTSRVISFKEIRGLNSTIKSELIKLGYQIIQAAPYSENGGSGVNVFNVGERAARGDFYDAEYVLQGAVVNASARRSRESIQGTSDFTFKLEKSLTIEFNLIHTESMQITAAFIVSGFGSDFYLGKSNAFFNPREDKIVRELLVSFGENSRIKLLENIPPVSKVSTDLGLVPPASESSVGDSGTLRIYTPARSSNDARPAENKSPVTIFRN